MTAATATQEGLIRALKAEEARCAALQDRIAILEEQVRTLTRADRNGALTAIFGFSASEATLLSLLLTRNEVRHEQFYAALYDDRPEADQPEAGSNIVSVLMCKMRRKLRAGLGLTRREDPVLNIWGHGYRLTADARRAVYSKLEREEA